MRVIAGKLGGRIFNSPHGHKTHPMSEKVRGAIFNALGDINGLSVLDCFSGSGAVAFEAVSRGAGSVVCIEADNLAYRTIKENISLLGIEDKLIVNKAFIEAWSKRNNDLLFDLVFMDPPYDKVNEPALTEVSKHAKPGGLIILSLPPDLSYQADSNLFSLLSSKNYGDACIIIYRRR